MHARAILRDLQYVSQVASKKQTYYVYEGDGYYVLLTRSRRSRNSYNLNAVTSDTVDYVRKRFDGRQQLTSKQVMKESRRKFRDRFAVLNTLYVLCATGDARIDKRFQEQQLFFNMKRTRA